MKISNLLAALPLALTLASGAALAADLPYSAPAPIPGSAPIISWQGFYVGGVGAYGSGSTKGTITAPGPLAGEPGLNLGTSGGLLGGTLGYNFAPIGNWVWGIEGDVSGGSISGSGAYGPVGPIPVTAGTDNLTWLATLRARLGWTNNVFGGSTLWYVTAGGAWAGANRDMDNSIILPTRASASFSGWTAGLGVEHAITQHWSVKAEYLYVDLGSANYNFSTNVGPSTTRVSMTDNLFRLGVNYKF